MALSKFMSRYVLPATQQRLGLQPVKKQPQPLNFGQVTGGNTGQVTGGKPKLSSLPVISGSQGGSQGGSMSWADPTGTNNTYVPPNPYEQPSQGSVRIWYPNPNSPVPVKTKDTVAQQPSAVGTISQNPFNYNFPVYQQYQFEIPQRVVPPDVTATAEFQKAAAAIPNYLKAMGIQAPEDTRESAYKAAYSKLDQAINAAAPARFRGGLQEAANLKQVRDVFVPAQAAIEDQYARAQQQYARDVMSLGEAGMRNALLAAMQSQKLATEAGLDNARLNLEAQRSQANEQRTAFDINRMTPWELRNMLAISGSDEYNRALRAMGLPEHLYKAYKL